jgi:hypothetical protein
VGGEDKGKEIDNDIGGVTFLSFTDGGSPFFFISISLIAMAAVG